jgi:hypothetical protein
MTSPHPDIGPELRQLAQAILDRLDPTVRAAAAAAGAALRGPGKCQQVWCPVCALAALASGEQHPLLNLVAEHSVTLLAMVRAMAADPADSPGADVAESGPNAANLSGADAANLSGADAAYLSGPDVQPTGDTPPPTQNGRYHHIPIVVESNAEAPVDCS